MKHVFLNRLRAVVYLLGSLFCIGIWHWSKNQIVFLDERVLLILCESPYQSLSVPLWGANLIVGLLLVFIPPLIIPTLRRRKLYLVISAVLCTALFLLSYIHYETLLLFSYRLLLVSVSLALFIRGFVGMKFHRLSALRDWFFFSGNYHTVSYLFGTIFCFLLGNWFRTHLILLDERVFLILRESPYQSLSVPLWSANLIAGLLLCFMLFLIMPVLRRNWLHFTVFTVFPAGCYTAIICTHQNGAF